MSLTFQSAPRNIYVTVGSTSFDELINTVILPETIEQLKRLGAERLTIQSGNYEHEIDSANFTDIEVLCYRYTDDFPREVMKADLIIGHAGAGTCLEALRQRKRLLVVTNDSLMGGHQDELADQLSSDNYLIRTGMKDFHDNLEFICRNQIQLREFPSAKESKFETIFNQALDRARN